MSRKTRGSLINPNEVTIAHTVAKTSRNLFLLGEDFATRTSNSHRKDWILDILEVPGTVPAFFATFRRSLTRGDREGWIDDCRVIIADF